MLSLFAVEWTESSGRVDGISFHRNSEDADKFIEVTSKKSDESHLTPNKKIYDVSESLHRHVMTKGNTWLPFSGRKAYKEFLMEVEFA